MFKQLITTQWAELFVILIAISFNMYCHRADRGVYTVGSLVAKFKVQVEVVNWLLLTVLVVHLSYLYSWYLLGSLFLLPIVGDNVASCFRSFTPLVYLIAMPVFMEFFIIKTFF
ncbi:MAG: hypothetical protein ACOYL3_08855 [Desulfuromonadaceae bacterium]